MGLRHDAWFAEGERQEFNAACEQLLMRHRYEDDPAAYAREHSQERCAVWHRGQTIVGATGFDPEARLAKEWQ